MVTQTSRWFALPDEIQLQILNHLNPQSLLSFGICSRACQMLIQDEQLSINIIRTHYPLAHARMAVEASQSRASSVAWPEQLRRTDILHECLTRRKALDYFELLVGRDIPTSYCNDLGPTPRERHSAKYNFDKLVLYFTGISTCVLIKLCTKEVIEFILPEPYSVRDVYIEEEIILILSTRTSSQVVLTYNTDGVLLRTLDTKRIDLAFLMANQKYILLYSMDSQLWFYYDALVAETVSAPGQSFIRESAGSTLHTQAVDDTYFYQKQNIGSTNVLLIYHLDLKYVVSRIAFHPGKEIINSEISGVNRHVYLSGLDQFTHIRGLDIVNEALPIGIPRDDDPIWDSKMLADLGAWIGWMGEAEDGIPFGLFAILLRESSSGGILDCGRIRGPTEPDEQPEMKSVSLLGDQKWITCISTQSILIWRVQR